MTTDPDRPMMDGGQRIVLCAAGFVLTTIGIVLMRRFPMGSDQVYFGWLGVALMVQGVTIVLFYGGRGITPGRHRLPSRKKVLLCAGLICVLLLVMWVRG